MVQTFQSKGKMFHNKANLPVPDHTIFKILPLLIPIVFCPKKVVQNFYTSNLQYINKIISVIFCKTNAKCPNKTQSVQYKFITSHLVNGSDF